MGPNPLSPSGKRLGNVPVQASVRLSPGKCCCQRSRSQGQGALAAPRTECGPSGGWRKARGDVPRRKAGALEEEEREKQGRGGLGRLNVCSRPPRRLRACGLGTEPLHGLGGTRGLPLRPLPRLVLFLR